MIEKLEMTLSTAQQKQGPNLAPQNNGGDNKRKQQNHHLRILSRSHWGLKLILLPNLTPDSAVVNPEKNV